MIFYLFYFFCIICTSAVVTYGNNRYVISIFKIITFMLLFVPAAFRYNVGTDYENYIDLFYIINNGVGDFIEPGYRLLNQIVSIYGGDAQLVLAISAFITLFFFFYGVENEKWFIYSILFFVICWIWYCSTVRQMIACSLSFYAWREWDKKKYVHTIIAIIMACTFHYSSLIYPALFLIVKKISISKWVMLVCLAICVVLSYTETLRGLIIRAIEYTPYGDYLMTDWIDAPNSSGLGHLLHVFTYMIIIIFFPDKNKDILFLFFMYAIIEIMAAQVAIIDRIGRGLIFIWLPIMYQMTRGKYFYKPIICPLVYFSLLTYFMFQLYNGFNNCSPYMSIYDKTNGIIR